MPMNRVNTVKLNSAVTKASEKLEEAAAQLRPYLVMLTDKKRSQMPRVRDTFPTAARELAHAIAPHAKITALAEVDPEAVIEELNNIAALAPLAHQLDELWQLFNDSKLTWNAAALQQSLAVYSIAKVRAKNEADLKPVLDAFAPVYAANRSRKAAPKPSPKPAEAK